MTTIELDELKHFANALKQFEDNVTKHCNTMEQGISNCGQFMKDATSQKILHDGRQVCLDIKECLAPTVMLLIKIRKVISIMTNDLEM